MFKFCLLAAVVFLAGGCFAAGQVLPGLTLSRPPAGTVIDRYLVLVPSVGLSTQLASDLAAPGILAQTRAPLRLGNLNSFTGAIAYAAENNFNAMSLYFDSIGWSIAGRKIELIKEDDQFNPQVGLQKAKKLVESDKVDMIVGVQASNVALAVLNYAKQQKAFYVVSGAGTDAVTWDRYPYLFRTSISTYQLSTPMASWVYDNLGKEIVTTASDYAGGRDVIAQFKGPYLAKGGKVLKEIDLGPVWCGPTVSRGRVYVGTGNLLFAPGVPQEAYFPKSIFGTVHSFGLPGEDEVDRMKSGKE